MCDVEVFVPTQRLLASVICFAMHTQTHHVYRSMSTLHSARTPLEQYRGHVMVDVHDHLKAAMAFTASSSQYSTPPDDDAQQPAMQAFSAADNDHRYLRKRCAMLCAAFNSQPQTVSLQERSQAFHAYVCRSHNI